MPAGAYLSRRAVRHHLLSTQQTLAAWRSAPGLCTGEGWVLAGTGERVQFSGDSGGVLFTLPGKPSLRLELLVTGVPGSHNHWRSSSSVNQRSLGISP